MKAALINIETNLVENIIVADAEKDPAPQGYKLIDVTNVDCGMGYRYDNNTNSFIKVTE